MSAQRTPDGFSVELWSSREHLWLTQFTEWLLYDVRRDPGVDVFRGRVALADASAALEHLNTAVSATPAGRGLGVDGITVGIESRLPELECSFTVWSPRKPGERGFELTSALLALAATIQDDAAQHVLATLR